MNRLRIVDCGLRISMGMLAVVLTASASPAAPPVSPGENHAALKRQMQEFERVLNTALRQMFDDRPFFVLQEPKSAYLPGFGVVVHAEVNLYPMRFIFPFAPDPYSERELKTEHEQKALRMKELRVRLRELLLAQTSAFSQLGGEENLAVVIHLYNARPYPEIPSQIVVQARHQALLDLREQGRKPEPAELSRVITLREF